MSILNQISKPITAVVSPAQKPVPADPYFYKKFDSGVTIGKADEKDVSGRPFFAYRNPGDESTTTDKTRVASTFDPTIAQPLTKEQYYNPRAEGLRKDFHDKYGIKSSEQLDHAIALAVGGSNDESNLRAIPTAENQKAGHLEGDLARKLVSGDISYLGAQIADAKSKGIKLPWEPAGVYVEHPGDKTLYDSPDSRIIQPHQSFMDELLNGKKQTFYKKSPEEKGRYLLAHGGGQPAEATMYNPDQKQTDSSPTIMASGKKIYDGAIATSDYKMPLGTQVYIPQLNRIFTVEDRMNRRYSPETYGKIVFDIPTTSSGESDKNTAKGFGRQKLTYVVVGHDGRKEVKAEQ